MIQANITSYIGQDGDAEHYYCHYIIIPDCEPESQYMSTQSGSEELKHKLTEAEAVRLNKKDNDIGYSNSYFHVGSTTNRFESFKTIHKDLIKKFPNEIIITYRDSRLFKEMLYYKNGVNLGYKAFGEVWNDCPTSCWSDLLPEDRSTIKIKCDDCGKEYTIDEVSYETESQDWYNEGKLRKWTKFYTKRNFEDETCNDICCKYFNLMWNVVL